MPLTDEGGAITSLPQQRRQGWMFRRQSDLTGAGAGQRFFEADWQTILIPPSDKGGTRCRAHSRISVRLKEAQAVRGDAIHIGGGIITSSITGEIGVA